MNSTAQYACVPPDEIRRRIENGNPLVLVDVRTMHEYANRHIPGVLLMPLDEFADRCRSLSAEDEIICICEHGIRSEMAAQYLAALGFLHVATMTGGMAKYHGTVENAG